MFGLQIEPMLQGVFKTLPRLKQDLYRVVIGDTLERAIQHPLQTLQQPLVHKSIEEGHLLSRGFQSVPDQILDKRLGQIHVPPQIAESHFRLNHPELAGVACGV